MCVCASLYLCVCVLLFVCMVNIYVGKRVRVVNKCASLSVGDVCERDCVCVCVRAVRGLHVW